MKALILLITVILITSCCENTQRVKHTVIEKVNAGDKYGDVHYYLLIDNGCEIPVSPSLYVKYDIGDSCFLNECLDK